MRRLATRFAIPCGLLIALAGFALDLLPGTRSGFHSLQILGILLGLSICLLPLAARRFRTRKSWRSLARALTKAAIVTLLTLIALELALRAVGYGAYFPDAVPDEFLRTAPWWTCEDRACRNIADEVARACESGLLSGRDCIVNAQGFHDTQDFIYDPSLDGQTRILVLGDSFTYGQQADIGKSYVERIEAGGARRTVWNTGLIGVGTNQSLAAFHMFAPALKPHLTIYGFYVNDFFDNLFPVDGYFLGINANGEIVRLQNYHLDPWGNATRLEDQSRLYYRWRGVEAPANEVERALGATRLGSIVISAIDQVGKQLGIAQATHWRRQVELTRDYLRELRDASRGARQPALDHADPQENRSEESGDRISAGDAIV